VYVPVEIASPPAVVTFIEPVVALLGTVASTWVSEVQWRAVADLEPKLTAVFPSPLIKFVPVIVTEVPAPTSVGVKLEIVGAG
jgi:hypothetical protein